jgi:hypothetical protein
MKKQTPFQRQRQRLRDRIDKEEDEDIKRELNKRKFVQTIRIYCCLWLQKPFYKLK